MTAAVSTILNLVGMTVTGAPTTGDITLNAAIPGYLTYTQAGATNGITVTYLAVDGGTVRDLGRAVLNTGTGVLSGRTCVKSTNGNANASLSADALIYFSVANTDILSLLGGTMLGLLTTLASAVGTAGFNIPHGTAPTSPVDGDIWTTTAGGLFARINGATENLAALSIAQTWAGIQTFTPVTNQSNVNAPQYDHGNSGAATVTFNVTSGTAGQFGYSHKVTTTGAVTLAFGNWGASPNLSACEVELVGDGTARVVTMPTVNWYKGDGTYSTTFSDMGVTLYSTTTTAKANVLLIWTYDGGTTLWGRAM